MSGVSAPDFDILGARRGRCRILTSMANHEAPAIAEADMFIDAPIQVVWDILSDFERWPTWNKSVSRMRVDGPVKVGTTFEWLADHWRITSRLEEVDPPRRIAWSGETLAIRAMHIWDLAEEGQGTRVHTVGILRGLGSEAVSRFRKEDAGQIPRPGRGGPQGGSRIAGPAFLIRGHNTNFRFISASRGLKSVLTD